MIPPILSNRPTAVSPPAIDKKLQGPGEQETGKGFWKSLGPGIVTGASDDDPSGIATYSQAGAQFGYSMLWTMVFTYPLMSAIQIISARIGRVTGRGLAANMRSNYHPAVILVLVSLLFIANTINLGADIGAIGEATRMVLGGNALWYAILFTLGSVLLQLYMPYHRYAKILKWMTLVLLSYVAIVFLVDIPFDEVAVGTFLPRVHWNNDYLRMIVALFGTTISPYLFFWQASQEVEEVKGSRALNPLRRAPLQAPYAYHRIHLDTLVGMGFSNLVAYFIILSTAAVLHAHGVTNITTATEAAQALRPLAGKYAYLLFSIGIIGTGLLAVPILAGSAAFALSETFKFRMGLERKPKEAKRFYAVIVISCVIGVGLNYSHIDPIRALLWSAVLNGIIAVPLMVTIMLMSHDRRVMKKFIIGRKLQVGGWLATIVMIIAVLGLFVTL